MNPGVRGPVRSLESVFPTIRGAAVTVTVELTDEELSDLIEETEAEVPAEAAREAIVRFI